MQKKQHQSGDLSLDEADVRSQKSDKTRGGRSRSISPTLCKALYRVCPEEYSSSWPVRGRHTDDVRAEHWQAWPLNEAPQQPLCMKLLLLRVCPRNASPLVLVGVCPRNASPVVLVGVCPRNASALVLVRVDPTNASPLVLVGVKWRRKCLPE